MKLTNGKLVMPFIIVRDNRERRAGWEFKNVHLIHKGMAEPVQVEVITQHMPTADYSVKDWETRFAIERKAPADLAGTLTRGRSRFVKELERLESFEFSAIIVESTWENFMRYVLAQTRGTPQSIDASIMSFMMRYPTRWLWRQDARVAEKTALKLTIRYLSERGMKI